MSNVNSVPGPLAVRETTSVWDNASGFGLQVLADTGMLDVMRPNRRPKTYQVVWWGHDNLFIFRSVRAGAPSTYYACWVTEKPRFTPLDSYQVAVVHVDGGS